MAKSLDHKAPSIKRRIEAMKALASRGWKIGLRFDPLIHGKEWEKLYSELLTEIFHHIPSDSIHSITYGVLRFPKKMHKVVSEAHPNSKLFVGPFENRDGIVAYKKEIEEKMIDFCKSFSSDYVSSKLIFKCMS